MATLPENIGFDTTFILAAQPSLTWIIDKTINQVVGMDSGLESVRQAVEIILNAERYRWQIYSNNFGIELDDLIGESEDYIQSELPRMVSDALMQDNRVTAVDDFAFSRNGSDAMTVSFSVHCVYGTLPEEVTI